MPQVMPLDKERIPYGYEITFDDVVYEFFWTYNSQHDYFSVQLSQSDIILASAEKISLNIPMFEAMNYDTQGNRNLAYPKKLFLPVDISNLEKRITYGNFYKNIFIFAFDKNF